MQDELQRVWKEADVASWHLSEGADKMPGIPVEIETAQLLRTSLEILPLH
jgi:hypothetical protein